MLYIGYCEYREWSEHRKKIKKISLFELQRVVNCLCSLCTHQVPLNRLQIGILGLSGGGVHGPSGHYVGPYGCSSTRIVTK